MVVKKRLHMARDLTTLEENARRHTKTFCDKNLIALQRALPTLLEKANAEFETGDEETAFLLYMRYADLAEFLLRRLEIKDKSSLYEDLGRVITRCEQLSVSLRQRYEEARLEVELLNCPAPPESAPVEPQTEQKIPNVPNVTKDPELLVSPMVPVLPVSPIVATAEGGSNAAPRLNSVITDVPIQKD